MSPPGLRAARTTASGAVLLLAALPLAAQTAPDRRPASSAVYVEALGSALYYSVSGERAFLRPPIRPYARLGAMWIPDTFSPTWGILAGGGVEVGRRPSIELGGLRVFGEADDEDIPPGWSFVGALRLHPGRWLVRFGATWLLSDRTVLGERESRLWPLASLGITF